mmetsp:Transcript_24448/g.44322  ORF Transcript_24448/g.44322 Transcript_24448/m.44322 type:complete len:87 (-) Transcript_24448:348-608(-)
MHTYAGHWTVGTQWNECHMIVSIVYSSTILTSLIQYISIHACFHMFKCVGFPWVVLTHPTCDLASVVWSTVCNGVVYCLQWPEWPL